MGGIFIDLAVIIISNDNMVLINVFTEIWEHSDIAMLKSIGARNSNGQTIRWVANKPR